MRHIFSCLLLTMCLFVMDFLHAQPVTIQNETAQVEYYRLPDEPLPASFTTYSAELDVLFRDISKTNLTESGLVDQYLRLEGYKEVSSRGDVQIFAGIGEFFIWGEFRKTSRHKQKDKQILKYYIEVKYSLPMSIQVRDKTGEQHIDKYIFTNADTKTWISPSYERSSDLDSYWRVQRSSRLATLQKDQILEGMKSIYDLINNRFGFRRIKETIRFETIGKKAHPLYEGYMKQVESLKAAFALMNADKGLDDIRSRVKPALAFYAGEGAIPTSGGKDGERLRHICLYNQALAYFWLEDLDKAEELTRTIQKSDARDKDAKRLLEDIEYTRTSLALNKRTSRHKVVVGKT